MYIPRPLPDFIDFSPQLWDEIGEWPGNEARYVVSGLGMRLGMWLVAWASHTKLLTLGPNSLIISFSSAACMDFLRCNLSPLFLFSHTNDIVTNLISVAMNLTLTNMFSTAQHSKEPFCNGVWRALILLASCLLGSLVRNVCWLFLNA